MCLAMNATVRIGTMKNDDNQQMKPNKKIPKTAPHGVVLGILLREWKRIFSNEFQKLAIGTTDILYPFFSMMRMSLLVTMTRLLHFSSSAHSIRLSTSRLSVLGLLMS